MAIPVLKNISKLKMLYFFALILFTSCDITKEFSDTGNKQSSLKITQQYDKYVEPDCPNANCASIQIRSISIAENHRINQFVEKKLTNTLLEFTRSGKAKTTQEAIELFFNDFKGFKEAFPESQTPWEIELEMTADWMDQAKGYLSIRMQTYSYTGGAHPNYFVQYFNLTDQGKELKRRDWLDDKKKLNEIAERFFREDQDIAATQQLSDANFVFDGNQFELPENIGFEEGHMVLYYNPYEIASYADGPIEIRIPYKELTGVFKD